MSELVYKALTPNQQRIRLVRIFPREAGSTLGEPNSSGPQETAPSNQIQCSISHFSLHDTPPYQALSYTWGPPLRKTPITANGQASAVTKNLEAALRHLRSDKEIVSVWIDDLCINQQDDAEKSQQVGQMRDIYNRATAVRSWLGPAADDSDIAMRWIREFGQRSYELEIGSKPELLLRNLLNCPLEQRNSLLGDEMQKFLLDLERSWTDMGTESGKLISALSKLLKRPYWSRIWVVQEILAATQLEFVCGTESVSDEALHAAIRLVRNYQDYRRVKYGPSNLQFLGSDVDTSLPTINQINLFKVRRAGGALPLMYLLRSLRSFSASDPRDKVFAILGIARDAEELGLTPDYSKSCAEVYVNTAKALLKHGYLEVLSLCNTSPSNLVLPSWVPDWSMSTNAKTLQERSLNRKSEDLSTTLQPHFQAWIGSLAIQLSVSESTTSLGLPSKFLGKITRLGRTWSPGAPYNWLNDLVELSRISGDSPDSVWRTAVTDQAVRSGANSAKPRVSDETIANVDLLMGSLHDPTSLTKQMLEVGLGSYNKQMSETGHNRRPFLVEEKYLGVGPAEVKVDDSIYLIPGGSVPYVFRPSSSMDSMVLIGETYVHGMMDGKAVDGPHSISLVELS